MNLYEILEKQLKKEPNFVTDNGELKKWVVLNKAQNFDEEILELLLDNTELKEKFFVNVKGTLIFNQTLFTQFLEQKNYLNDSYTQYKNKVGLTIDGKYLKQRNDVALVWPFKDCVLEGGQSREEDKREEIFFNEVLAQDEITQLFEPKVLTNAKRIDADGEKPFDQFIRDKNGTITDNLVIKGNNLLALHTLKKEFAGKVKLIYIDPPYNTGDDDFCYNDKFNHSTWLTFIENRLLIAKELLRPDGVIFIQINDIEEAYLKVLCDEIFNRDCFHTSICVQMSHLSGVKMAHKEKKLPKIKEYILFYTKNKKINLIPQYIPASWDDALDRYSSFIVKGNYPENECSNWEIIPLGEAIKKAGINKDDTKAVLNFKINNAELIFRTARNRGADYSNLNPNVFTKIDNHDGTYYFVYKGEDVSFAAEKIIEQDGKLIPVVAVGDIWSDIGINNLSNEGGVDLRFGKKPEKLIERLIKMISTSEDDIILDFFAGSGTTGAVAHKLKRKYIIVEQLDNHIIKSVNRLKRVIQEKEKGNKDNNRQSGGGFIFLELKKYNQTFIEQIEEAKDTKTLLQIWEQMKIKSFLNYNVDIKKQDEHIEDFKTLNLQDQKIHLCELLDKNQLYVNLSSLNDTDFQCSEEEKRLNKDFYRIEG
ncbi:DNA methyltransferase [Treponema sp. R6D11]